MACCPSTRRPQPSIWVGGEPLTPKTLDTIRQRVGLLFQDPDDQLISATVFEDVAFGPRQLGLDGGHLPPLVAHCLGLVGLRGFEEREPHRLSHGEKRRVCLAGVLACKPTVLVLDEPTSDLDPRGRREFKTPAPILARRQNHCHPRPRTGGGSLLARDNSR